MEHDLVKAARESDVCNQLERLAGHRWESHILLRLDEAKNPPRRYALKTAINHAAGEAIADNTLDRIEVCLS